MTQYSKISTKNGAHLCCHPLLPMPQLQVTKHPTHKKKPVQQVFITTNTSLQLQTFDHNHNEFLHLFQYHGNIYLDMSHGTDKKVKLRAHWLKIIACTTRSIPIWISSGVMRQTMEISER
jgi:hypothetical protein